MATAIQNATAILDALADWAGKTLTASQKTAFVERFIDEIGNTGMTNTEKAEEFLADMRRIVVKVSRNHVEENERQTNAAAVEAAGQAVEDEL